MRAARYDVDHHAAAQAGQRVGLGFLGLAIGARLRGVRTGSICGTALVKTPLGGRITDPSAGA